MAQNIPAKYNQSIRTFALTLNVLSPRAYGYVRQKFNNNLPHPSTLRKWYANSSSNGEPGLSKDSLHVLRALVEKYREKQTDIYVTLAFDEMNIRRHVQYSDTMKRFLGNITYGSIPRNAEYFPVANNAIVFMVNGINIRFNIPVAMHFINSLQAHEKAALISIVIEALTNVGVKVIAITFDGLGTNTPTCNLLGACFNIYKDFRPYILNPVNREKIFVMFDAPHMIKLIRNCIGTKKVIYYGNESKIEWKFYENLEQLRSKYDIVTHKLTKQHILFEKNIMNVSLATQLLSASVAESMEHFSMLPETKHLFEGVEITSDFTRKMDKLFDIFNSKLSSSGSNNNFKNPINNTTKNEIFSFLDEMVNYIKQLKLEDQNILFSRRKTAFKGFIVNIHNLKELYTTYVESNIISALPTNSLNQDPLEFFFGRIRSCSGSNDNPTVEQFCSAYRKTLVSSELRCSTLSNCVDELSILHVPASQKPRMNAPNVIVRVEQTFSTSRKRNFSAASSTGVEEIENLLMPKRTEENSDLYSFDGSNITVSYLAAKLGKKIEETTRSHCEHCINIMKNIFKENLKFESSHSIGRVPCQSTVDICRKANDNLRIHAYKFDFNYASLLRAFEESLELYILYEKSDFSHNETHKIDLIRFIIEDFIRVRASYIARCITLNEKKKLLRRKHLKNVHFAGE